MKTFEEIELMTHEQLAKEVEKLMKGDHDINRWAIMTEVNSRIFWAHGDD